MAALLKISVSSPTLLPSRLAFTLQTARTMLCTSPAQPEIACPNTQLTVHDDADYSTSNGDYLADQRWTALSRVGEAAGWLIDPGEVRLSLYLLACLAPTLPYKSSKAFPATCLRPFVQEGDLLYDRGVEVQAV